MPGITGIISRKPAAECERAVKIMAATLKHESFHPTGTFSVPELGVFAGWVAHENSFADKQVFQNETRDIALLFSGECYVEAETKNRLRKNGHSFSSGGGDSLVHLYEDLGEKFFEALNGLFSGLLIDRRQRKIFLFNDRYGMERIYWHETPDAFYFASEAKALLRILPELRSFDAAGLNEFLTFGCTLDEQTLFRGIQRLPGGARWTFTDGHRLPENYFIPETWEELPEISATEFESRFHEVFKKILPRYFSSDSKIGIALTGGLDTRMIMACRPQDSHSQTTYTFAGKNGETLDDQIAARVAAACGLDHKLLRLHPDFFSSFAAHADETVFVTDGCSGISGAHEIYFNRQAREIAPVRLTGNYGSEVFRGISTFKPLPLSPQLFNPDLGRKVISEAQKFSEQKKEPMTFAIFKEIPWNLFGNLAAGRSQVGFRTPYLDNELVALAYQSPEAIRKSSLPASRLVKANSKILSEIPTDRGFAGNNFGLKYLCRRAFAEVTFKTDYYNNEGLPRPLAPFDPAFKFVASKLKLAGLHKFLHYNDWFRHGLSSYLQSALDVPQVRQSRFWNPYFVKRIAAEHITGRKNYSLEINAVLTLEAIERLLFRELPRDN
jgi:asparagine synthase (glutamine-hydrolysing)